MQNDWPVLMRPKRASKELEPTLLLPSFLYKCLCMQRRIVDVLPCHSAPLSPETGSVTEPGSSIWLE